VSPALPAPAKGVTLSASTPRASAAAAVLDQGAMQHLMGYRLTLAEVASRRAFQRHVGTPFKLRPVEFTILVLLLGNGSATPKQLALTLGLPPPNVTVLVDRLVERALVQRQRSDTDGRAMNLRLTNKGTELARRVHRVSQTMESALLAPLSAAERAMLAELLLKLPLGQRAAGA
jgi:DNA-binding MarR family transcriptional regulator